MSPFHNVKVLIPDLPSADDLLPWLQRIDAARWYTNFGSLLREFEEMLASQWPVVFPGMSDLNPMRVVTLSSGTHALELGIAALELNQGGERVDDILCREADHTAKAERGSFAFVIGWPFVSNKYGALPECPSILTVSSIPSFRRRLHTHRRSQKP